MIRIVFAPMYRGTALPSGVGPVNAAAVRKLGVGMDADGTVLLGLATRLLSVFRGGGIVRRERENVIVLEMHTSHKYMRTAPLTDGVCRTASRHFPLFNARARTGSCARFPASRWAGVDASPPEESSAS